MTCAASRRAFLATLAWTGSALALGRTPYGGVLRIQVPLSLEGLDPHAANDATSALFADAIADPLFAWDSAQRPYPTLAAELPQATPAGARVTLRPGLVTARGRALDARDVIASFERSKRAAGRPLLAALPSPTRVAGDPLSVVFAGTTPDVVADALSSPVTALVPRSFVPAEPDGTGAFRCTRTGTGLVLERNEHAARGPSYLARIEIRKATDLATGLRAFEAGDADVGWLGAGLHRRRTGAVDFRCASRGLVVLRTGTDAKNWSAPGVAQHLVEGMDPKRLAYLGLAPRSGDSGGTWGGPPADVLVDEGSPYLVEVARVMAAALGASGHELRPLPLPNLELRRRVDERRYALAVDVVRLIGPSPRHLLLALLAAADPKLAEKPPHLSIVDPAALARTLPLAVLGEFAPFGAHAAPVQGLTAWDLGAVWMTRA
jgi:peptide/nickel transport system substrate-binding protein